MHPIQVGDLVLYVSKSLQVRVIGTVVEVIVSGEAYMDPFYRIIWNHPDYEKMDTTVYDMKQVLLWRHCFVEFDRDEM